MSSTSAIAPVSTPEDQHDEEDITQRALWSNKANRSESDPQSRPLSRKGKEKETNPPATSYGYSEDQYVPESPGYSPNIAGASSYPPLNDEEEETRRVQEVRHSTLPLIPLIDK